jgi:hypothetical protein
MRRGALLLAGALLADVAEYLLDPMNGDAGTTVYDAAVQHPGRLVASAVALLVSAFLIVPAVRGLALGRVPTALSILGSMGHAALATLYLVWTQLPEGGRGEMVALVERVNSAGSMMLVGVLVISFALTFLAVTIAMARARIVPVWTVGFVVAGAVAQGATQNADLPVSLLPLALVGGAVAIIVQRCASGDAPRSRPRVSRSALGATTG